MCPKNNAATTSAAEQTGGGMAAAGRGGRRDGVDAQLIRDALQNSISVSIMNEEV